MWSQPLRNQCGTNAFIGWGAPNLLVPHWLGAHNIGSALVGSGKPMRNHCGTIIALLRESSRRGKEEHIVAGKDSHTGKDTLKGKQLLLHTLTRLTRLGTRTLGKTRSRERHAQGETTTTPHTHFDSEQEKKDSHEK